MNPGLYPDCDRDLFTARLPSAVSLNAARDEVNEVHEGTRVRGYDGEDRRGRAARMHARGSLNSDVRNMDKDGHVRAVSVDTLDAHWPANQDGKPAHPIVSASDAHSSSPRARVLRAGALARCPTERPNDRPATRRPTTQTAQERQERPLTPLLCSTPLLQSN